jgi:WD40 repeat protein
MQIKPEVVVQIGHLNVVTDICFSPDGKLLATASADETVKIWDLRLRSEIRSFHQHEGPVYSVCFSPDGTHIASSGYDKTVRVWEVSSGKEWYVFSENDSVVHTIKFCNSGNFLAGGNDNNETLIWNVITGQLANTFKIPDNSSYRYAFALNSSGNKIAIINTKKLEINFFDVRNGSEIMTVKCPELDGLNSSESGECASMVFTADDKFVAIAHRNINIQLIDVEQGKKVTQLSVTDKFNEVEIRQDNTLVGFGEDVVSIIDFADYHIRKTISRTARAISPDGRLIAGIDPVFENVVVLWEVDSNKEICRFNNKINNEGFIGNAFRQFPLASNPRYPLFANGAPDGLIRLWDMRNSPGPRIIKATSDFLESLAFHPGGHILASSDSNGSIKIWNIFSGELEKEFSCDSRIHHLAFSLDGKYLIGGGHHNSILINTYSNTTHLLEHDGKIQANAVGFDPGNGDCFVAIENEIIFWSIVTLTSTTIKSNGTIAGICVSNGGLGAFAMSERKWLEGLAYSMQVTVNRPMQLFCFEITSSKLTGN